MRDYLKSKLGVPENWDKYDYQTQRYSFEDVEEILQTFKDEQLRLHNVSVSEAATCPKCGSKETQLIYAIYNHDCDKCGNSWEVEC